MPNVSVVVSIHNDMEYLPTCVDSLLAQTAKNPEIILVDDGSSDGSGSLADQLSRDYANVRVLHQQRHRPGEARNIGMRACTGDYLSFVNACDWVEPTMYEQLLKSAVEDEADIVSSGHCDVYNSVTCSVRPHPLAGIVLTRRQDILDVRKRLFGILPKESLARSLALFVGASLYRRTFIEENDLFFEDALATDALFSIAAYAHARCVSFACSTGYCYRMDGPAWRVHTHEWGNIDHYERLVGKLAHLMENEDDAAEYLKRVRHTAVTYAILYVGAIVSSDLNESQRASAVHRLAGSRVFRDYCVGFPRHGMALGERLVVHALEHDNVRAVLSLAHLHRMLCGRGAMSHGGPYGCQACVPSHCRGAARHAQYRRSDIVA